MGVWKNFRVYEPACGSQKAIADILEKSWENAEVSATDIIAPWHADFLNLDPHPVYDLIITNPPFSLAMEFIEKSFQWRKSDKSIVAMLLRLNFLGSKKRASWLRQHTPSVYVSPKRPSFALNKDGKRGTDSIEYAWFVWDGDPPRIHILPTENCG